MKNPSKRASILLSMVLFTNFFAGAGNPAASINTQTGTFTKLDLYANIETVGVVISGTALPINAELQYRRSGEINWRRGHPLVRIDDGRLAGSLFGLSPSTSYEIRVLNGPNEISGSVFTQPDDLSFNPTVILHVNDDAPLGGNGSVTAPFRTIQEAVNGARPGTQVLVSDGIYRESISFPSSGGAGNWIQVKAEGGGAVIEGSDNFSGNVWLPVEGRSNVWSTHIGGAIGYLARDGSRFYRYDDLNGLLTSAGHNNIRMSEGWHFDTNTLTLFIRSLDDPARHIWQVPRFNHAFDVIGQEWIWIEGFEIRFFGTRTDGCGVCTMNASHVVIRRNKIHNLQLGVFINWNGSDTQGNDTRIDFNEIYDPPVDEWPWNAVKSSSMEGSGIVLRGHIGAIVRGNEIHNFFNGIYTGVSGVAGENPAIAFDADIYNNRIHHISDDGLEPEGACVNHRFRNNSINQMLVGVSLAPITYGPVWVIRSTFANYTGKAVKWDRNSDGVVLMYHNTSWTNSLDASGMELISPIRNTTLRNNIFQMNGFSVIEKPTGSINNDWNNDNWHSTRTSSNPHFKWENINFNRIADFCRATSLECNGSDSDPGLVNPGGGNFTLLASSPNVDRGMLLPGINDNYNGVAPDRGAFEWQASASPTQTPFPTTSPTLTPFPSLTQPPATVSVFTESPTLIPATGLPPTLTTPSLTPFPIDYPPTVASVSRVDTSPTNAPVIRFRVTFSEFVTGVDSFPPMIDFALNTGGGISGAAIAGVTVESGASYIVQVNTGSGNGTIQLYALDDDSIRDSIGQPLGGAGIGNGNYLTGEMYTIDKPAPMPVTGIFRSVSSNDGWVLESQKDSESGGSRNASDTTFILGDDNRDRQYISILQFSTASLPDNARVTHVTLMIRSQGSTGTNPFVTHQNIAVDIRKGYFGSAGLFGVNSLDRGDFQAPASQNSVGFIFNNPITDWYWALLDAAANGFINLAGVTEFRLRFQLPDDNDRSYDLIRFYSGNYNSSTSQPLLQVEYYIP